MASRTESVGSGPVTGPRRQARGQQRIEQILHAAAVVFAERGYDTATTNAIAAEAGISPGSLYQFFKNKDDIAGALAAHYVTQLTALRGDAFRSEAIAGLSLDDAVTTVLEPLIAFNLAHPGFKALFARTDMPAGLREAVRPIQEAIHAQVADLIATFLPDRSRVDVARAATVAIQLVRAMTPLIAGASGDERRALVGELHAVLVSYLDEQSRRR